MAGIMCVCLHLFAVIHAAHACSLQVNGNMILDKIVFVGPFLTKGDRPASKEKFSNVYLKNLAPEVKTQQLSCWLACVMPSLSLSGWHMAYPALPYQLTTDALCA